MFRRLLILCLVCAPVAACLGCQTNDSAKASIERCFGPRGNFFTTTGDDLVR